MVGVSTNVANALEMIETHRIDAALLDITLGAENSFSIADRLTDLAVPFASVSAYTKKEIPARVHEVGLLARPVTPSVLTRHLDKMIGKAS